MQFGFQHTYASLPAGFYARLAPSHVSEPRLVVFNRGLAEELGLDPESLEARGADLFSGNEPPADADPIAMAYAGHQFGVFVPRLGDGRALLLGEIRDRDGELRDVQLKGAGLTPFSRNADGRAALGPMLREYLVSEAMHRLGVPTTRSLAVVSTGELVYREQPLPGAVLTRVAGSHLRVGTFQYFAARADWGAVRALLDYSIARHYPAASAAELPALAVLEEVIRRQAALIARWMLLGFIHGVMNTDNMAISGETIDYGPCAFMDEFDPNTVFSSIDHAGRYAYGNQPAIAQWNLTRFAETLLPLIDLDEATAIRRATAALEQFPDCFNNFFRDGMRRKLGLIAERTGDIELVRRLLEIMQDGRADFTLTFRSLADAAGNPEQEAQLRARFSRPEGIDAWIRDWRSRCDQESDSPAERSARMRCANPAFIPRNHRVNFALEAAERGDEAPFRKLLSVLQRPYEAQPESQEYAAPPQPEERVLQTFCGT